MARRKIWWLMGGGLGLLLVLAWVLWLGAFNIGNDPCGFEIRDQQLSPDGHRKAALGEVNCGAPTDYATWAVVTDAKAPFRFERDRVASISGRAMRIAWEGETLIVFVRPPTGSDVSPVS